MKKNGELKIKFLRSYRGGEFTLGKFNESCEKHGIKRKISVSRTPQQNGVAERNIIFVQEIARSMSLEAKLPVMF